MESASQKPSLMKLNKAYFQNIIPAKALVLFVKKNWLFGNSKTICPLQFGVVHLSFKAKN